MMATYIHIYIYTYTHLSLYLSIIYRSSFKKAHWPYAKPKPGLAAMRGAMPCFEALAHGVGVEVLARQLRSSWGKPCRVHGIICILVYAIWYKMHGILYMLYGMTYLVYGLFYMGYPICRNWVAVRELKFSYHNSELFSVNPYSGNLIEVP